MTSVSRRYMPARPLLVIALLVMSTVFWFLERSSFSWGFSWHYGLAAVLVAWYLRMLIHSNQAATLTSFFQIYYSVGMLISAAIVSSGAPMIEIDAQGSANGFFWLMLGFFIVGIEATFLGYRNSNLVWLRWRALRLPVGIDRTIFLAFILPTLLLSAYVLLLAGGPVLRGVDRVTFWRTLAPPGTALLPSLVAQSFFFVAFFYLLRHRLAGKMLLPQLILIAYIISGILILGEKFSLFITLLNMWLIVLVGLKPEFRFRVRHIVIGGAIAAFLLIVIATFYILEGREAIFILARAALQSQLLWRISEDSEALSLLPQNPECYFGCNGLKDGADYISFLYLPASRYEFYKDVGTVLSGFMPALPILTFGGVISLFLHSIICFSLGLLQGKITSALAERKPVYGFLLFKLQTGISLVWFAAKTTPLLGIIAALFAILTYRFISFAQMGANNYSQQRA